MSRRLVDFRGSAREPMYCRNANIRRQEAGTVPEPGRRGADVGYSAACAGTYSAR
jgi:hypothetical protein